MLQIFSQFVKSKAWVVIPACVCMFTLTADDATTQTPPQPQDQNKQPAASMPNNMSNPQMNNQNDNQSGGSPLARDNDDDEKNGGNCKDSDRKVAKLDDENPNDPTKAPDIIADATSSSAQSSVSKTMAAQSDGAVCAIKENKESGRWLTFDNGMTFEVPTVLRKRSASWQIGDKVTLEKGKRDSWYKLINATRHDKLRARLTTPATQK